MLLRNNSSQLDHVVLQQVAPETTPASFRLALVEPDAAAFFFRPGVAATAALSPRTQVLWNYHLPAGKYALYCGYPDSTTGRLHALTGEFVLITLH